VGEASGEAKESQGMASRHEVEEGAHGGDDEHHAWEEVAPEVNSFIFIMQAMVPPGSFDEGSCWAAWSATPVEKWWEWVGESGGWAEREGVRWLKED